MPSWLRNASLLIWKNFVLQKRRPVGTVLEICVPILFSLILIAVRATVSTTNYAPNSFCSQFLVASDFTRVLQTGQSAIPRSSQYFCNAYSSSNNAFSKYNAIAYAPNTTEVQAVMGLVKTQFDQLSVQSGNQFSFSFVGFSSSSQIPAISESTSPLYYAGVVFNTDNGGSAGSDGINGNKVHVTLRLPDSLPNNNGGGQNGWQTDLNFPEFQPLGPVPSPYKNTGFLVLQASVDMALLAYLTNSTSLPNFAPRTKPYPFPAYSDNGFIFAIRSILPLFLVLSYLYTAICIVRELVLEKERRLKEAMRMMGLSNFVLWLTWFVKNLIFVLVSIVLITIIYKFGGVFKYSDGGLIFFFLLLFTISTIFYCFTISVFFSRGSVAAAAGGLLFFIGYFPYFFVQPNYATMTIGQKAAACLLSPTCVGIGTNIISIFESSGQGLTVDTASQDPADGDSFTMNFVFGMLILDCIIYMLIAWYVEAVFPGQYGVPHPPWFFLSRAYWCGSGGGYAALVDAGDDADDPIRLHPADFQPDPAGRAGIQIHSLKKVFDGVGGSKVAVNNLTLNLYEGQVTALLGRNGAGKTSTMSMLVGMYPPSSGTATINGYDIVSDLNLARNSLGLCPQFDILFDTLTVDEHLYFYARLKGTDLALIATERNQFVIDLELQPKRQALAGTLSGGQKRALSVAIAFIGGSKVVILDEPSSGMDPYKRRHTWDLILKYRQGRTILLTTHFMDEADLLGDRIAILGDGRLQCVGTPMFLKARFGVGYHMTVVKNSSCDSAAVQRLVTQMVPGATAMSDVGSELTFLLPREQSAVFPRLFTTLEDTQGPLGIDSYGVSVTTMEEVFLRVNTGGDAKSQAAEAEARRLSAAAPLMPSTTLLDGWRLRAQQLRGMFGKRMIHAVRYRAALLAQILLPVIFALAAILIAKTSTAGSSLPTRYFNPSASYGSNVAFRSARDLGSDVWSTLNASSYTAYAALGALPATSAQTFMATQTNQFFTSDPRMNRVIGNDQTSKNVTDWLLAGSASYLTSSYFRKNFFGLSFASDWFVVQGDSAGSCLMRSNSGTWARTDVTVTANGVYAFRAPAGTSNLQMRFYSDAGLTTQLSYPVVQSSSTTYQLVLTGQVLAQVFYVCNATAPAPSAANVITVVANSTTALDAAAGMTGYAWFSTKAIHAAPESLNVLDNVALRAATGDSTAAIYTYNWPLPKSIKDKIDDLKTDAAGFNLALFMIFGLGFLLPSFAIFVVTERVAKSKHIQFVSGISMPVYWAGNFVWDFFIFQFPAIAVVIVFAIFSIPALSGSNLGVVYLLLVLCAWHALPMVYVLGSLFSTPSGAYSRLAMLFIFLGIGALVAVFVLAIPSLNLGGASDAAKQAAFILPNYAFSQALLDMFYNENYRSICLTSASAYADCVSKGTVPQSTFSMTFPGIGRHVVFMAAYGVFFLLVLVLVEAGLARFLNVRRDPGPPQPDRDEDVAEERQRIEGGSVRESIVVNRVSKVFKVAGKPFTSVDNLSFGIPSGQCFGLLGVNGAGKTTCFRMLTGDTPLSSGSVAIDGYDLGTDLVNVRRRIGYCPQYNGLVELLTGRETLVYFARLRGYPEDHVATVATNLIAEFDLTRIADKPCGTYSGGNKRKLSTAIALVGNPPIVFLDEPTTGMDPTSRRFIWDALARVLARGQSIVLTTHSMEECEALCSRLAIMVNGQFRCLGSVQHLKHRFGRGFQLKMKVKQDRGNVAAVKDFVHSVFVRPVLKEEYNGEVTFQVDKEDRGWSYLFSRCAEAQRLYDLEDYSVSQTTLEQVFLEFAKHQLAEDTKGKDKVAALERVRTVDPTLHPTGVDANVAAANEALAPVHFFPTSGHDLQVMTGPSAVEPRHVKLTRL